MNTAQFAGRLGRNADLKNTGRDSVCNFSVAVDVGWGDRKKTLWVSCALWGERAEKLAQYLTKGTSVTVSGDVDLRQFDKKDGTAGAEITLNVQRLTLQGGGQRDTQERDTQGRADDPPQTPAEKSQGKPAGGGGSGEFDDEIPF
jgi:single-strand DNA-binding protein